MSPEQRRPLRALAGLGLLLLVLWAMLAHGRLWSAALVHPREFFSHDNYASGLAGGRELLERSSAWREVHPFHWGAALALRRLGSDFVDLNAVAAGYYVLYVLALAGLGRCLLGRGAGIRAGLLAALMPQAACFSRIYDSYTALLLFLTLAALCGLLAARRGSVLPALAAAAALWAGARLQLETTDAMLLAAGCCGLLAWAGIAALQRAREANDESRVRRGRRVITGLVLLTTCGLAALLAARAVLANPYYMEQLAEHAGQGPTLLQRALRFPLYYPVVLLLNLAGPLTLPAALMGLILLFKQRHPGRWPLLALSAFPLIVLTALTKKQENYAVILLPGLALAAAALLIRLRSPWRAPGLALLAGTTALWGLWGSASPAQHELCNRSIGPLLGDACWSISVPAEGYEEVEQLELDLRQLVNRAQPLLQPGSAVYFMSDNTLLARPGEFFLLRDLPGRPVRNMWTEGRFVAPLNSDDKIVICESQNLARDAGPADWSGHFYRNASVPDTDRYWEDLFVAGWLEVQVRQARCLLLGH